MSGDLAFAGVVALTAIGLFVGLRLVRVNRRELADEEPTVLHKPVANVANGPLYGVLCGITAQLARTPAALEDVAETLRQEREKARPSLYDRLADIFEDHAVVSRRAAQEVRDVKPQEA